MLLGVWLLELVLVGEHVGSMDTSVCAAPVEREAAGFEPGDQGRAGHAQERGGLAGGHLVRCRRLVHVSVDEVGEDGVDRRGCGRR